MQRKPHLPAPRQVRLKVRKHLVPMPIPLQMQHLQERLPVRLKVLNHPVRIYPMLLMQQQPVQIMHKMMQEPVQTQEPTQEMAGP